LSGRPSLSELEWFDHRYFWRADGTRRCHYICGLAREAGAVIVRQSDPDPFLHELWLNSLNAFEGNPCVVGFIVEQTCLSAISSLGFGHGDFHWKPAQIRIFEGNILESINLEDSSTLFIPQGWNYKDIDAIYVRVNKSEMTAEVVPIQVTMNDRHGDSEMRFFARWSNWESFFVGYKLTSTFVWIVRDRRSRENIEEHLRSLRSGERVVAPKHMRVYITAREVFEPLGQRLETLSKSRALTVPGPTIISHERPGSRMIVNEFPWQANVRVVS